MTYRVTMTIPATVTLTVDIEAENQQAAIVAGYDQAMAATASQVRVTTLESHAAMLESCEKLTAIVEAPYEAAPPSPHQLAAYLVQYFKTPESAAVGIPDIQLEHSSFDVAVEDCERLNQASGEYLRRVTDKLGNTLREKKNIFGRYVVVVFVDETVFSQGVYVGWEGWISDLKTAKQKALTLLDAGRVYAVGVVLSASNNQEEALIMKLSRSH